MVTEQEAKKVVLIELGKLRKELPQGITLEVTPNMVGMVCCASELIREIPLTSQTTIVALARDVRGSLLAMHRFGPTFARIKQGGGAIPATPRKRGELPN